MPTMKVHIGIPENHIVGVVDILQTAIADEQVLLTKTRNYHWNIQGPSFIEMHRLYEEQYNIIRETIDEVAERIKQLGKRAVGTMKEFLEITRLKEGPYFEHQDEQVKMLLDDHEAIIVNLRKDIEKVDETFNDVGTTDFLTGILEAHEKMAWMLRSYLG